jgi:hypothetical protein
MTIDDRTVLDLEDLKAVRFECKACGATTSFALNSWPRVPTSCPGCEVDWLGMSPNQLDGINKLRLGLAATLAVLKQDQQFAVRLEIARR